MLQEAITLFKVAYAQHGDQLILGNYALKTGLYLKIDLKGNILEQQVYDKRDGEENNKQNNQTYKWFSKRDYLSNLIDMNKPIDPKKKIHGNNYMSFFIKKDSLIGDKAIDRNEIKNRIKEYYSVLKNPVKNKYAKKKKALALYETIKEPINIEQLEACEAYMKENIGTLIEMCEKIEFTNYIKIFFDVPIEDYELESRRYYIPNLYNCNDYNVLIKDDIYGLTNFNMGLNAKKPYLAHKTRVTNVPCLINCTDILMHKQFFDWLATRKRGSLYIAYDSDFVTGVEESTKKLEAKGYYYFDLDQGSEPEIIHFDLIPLYNSWVQLSVDNYLKVEEKIDEKWCTLEPFHLDYRYQIEEYIDDFWFSKRLKSNYRTDAKEIKKISQPLKQMILATRQACYNFFRLSHDNSLSAIMKYAVELVKLQLKEGYSLRAAKGMNLYIAMKSQLGGYEEMPSILSNLRESSTEKIQQSETLDCQSDQEFYYLAGQLVRYLINQSKAKESNLKHDLVNSYLDCRNSNKLKKEILFSFQKYNHEIALKAKKFNNAMAMIQSYTPQNPRIDMEVFLIGYMASNMFYIKKEDK